MDRLEPIAQLDTLMSKSYIALARFSTSRTRVYYRVDRGEAEFLTISIHDGGLISTEDMRRAFKFVNANSPAARFLIPALDPRPERPPEPPLRASG